MPIISIGMPIFNNEKTIKKSINSILKQSFKDFELIISDNNSTDTTTEICKEYAKKDPRIIFIKQSTNIGAANNFKFVFNRASGEYFCWAAGDDIRSSNFLEENIRFLQNNPKYIASTSPNRFYKSHPDDTFSFSIVGSVEERYKFFFKNCWNSHAIFYSIFRRKAVKNFKSIGCSFAAADWFFNLQLLKLGQVHRTPKGLLIFGTKGVSLSSDPWSPFRTRAIEWLLPFYFFTKCTFVEIKNFSFKNKIFIFFRLFVLNFIVFFMPLKSFISKKINNFFA